MKAPIIVSTLLLSFLFFLLSPVWAAEEWTQIKHATSAVFKPGAVVFVDKNHAWAYQNLNNNKSHLKKMKGTSPTSWLDLRTFSFHIKTLTFKNTRVGFIAGDQGHLARTVNGGSTWYPTNYKTTKSLNDIDIRGKNIWVVGHDNTIVYSPDNGKNWQEINPGLKKKWIFNGVSFSSNKTGWVTGYRINKGARIIILYTRNGGRNWVVQTDNIKNMSKKFIPRDIHATEAGWAYIVGSKGSFLMTTDEGKTWKPALNWSMAEETTLHKISFPISRIGWISGDHGRVLRTNDAGFHWTLDRTPIRSCYSYCNLVDIHMFSPTSGYAFTSWGDVIKYAPK